ncbi:hypothetical protein BC939DRAFT_445132 [Gamsiella multidivaricata]|uniref:uncharacterized protein n=1 Tax=Gamsiella multidivaricata TaxID=101098 RepID=UPI00221E5664|nr:uncharacterized protein BC939DRAFT_445132 [Gamsiella multidivaricata]KAI7827410.1 hypothetical protein BC939DRAFT_445132 [Gamsiella multidivaricata]
MDAYDRFIFAEMPDKETHPAAYKTITKTMVHGLCGVLNSKSLCVITQRPTAMLPWTETTDTHLPSP